MIRRKFLGALGLGSWLAATASRRLADAVVDFSREKSPPLVLSTWNVPAANAAAWEALNAGKSALDAVVEGVAVEEADPAGQSVGIGGLPDREGQVTLDACVMDHRGNAGAVVYVRGYKHVAALARQVMEKTPHVILAGKGAEQFAEQQGFQREELLTDTARKAWKEWLKTAKYKPVINAELHDTIGMLAIDGRGRLSGACSTSGLAYKMNGRVGDSPIIGSGLFVDDEVGAATATGLGESILKVAGSAVIVELMRHGHSPQAACEEAIRRIARQEGSRDFQACFLALHKSGEVGACALQPGFVFTLTREGRHELVKATSYYPR